MNTKQCLIVAAGQGTRLREKGALKPLICVAGVPLIERAMHAASRAGVERFVVVTGYRTGDLEAGLSSIGSRRNWDVQTIFNPDFELANGLSVLAARPLLEARFFLAMCDHIVDSNIYRILDGYPLKQDEVGLGVDYRLDNPAVDIEDVTKVDLAGHTIQAIGKTLTDYNAYDTGVFLATSSLLEMIEGRWRVHKDGSISGGIQALAHRQRALGIDIGDAYWIDVDSSEMYEQAEADCSRHRTS